MRLRRRGGEDGGGGGEDRGWVSAAGGGGGDGSGGEWWPPLETNGRWSRGSRGLALSCLTVKTAAIHPSKSKTVVTQTLLYNDNNLGSDVEVSRKKEKNCKIVLPFSYCKVQIFPNMTVYINVRLNLSRGLPTALQCSLAN